ncbi:MAG: DNA helicase RecQ [Saprospiraceae bacterium]|nr:DNA helicase RecQ [Saprospiraceae bacterium]
MNLIQAKEALKKYFGYDTFRPMQAEIIQQLVDGSDALVLMPTGGGKSICFQIPALIMEGTCIVVSPLISLMKDQVEGLRSNGVRASYLNSSLRITEQRAVEEEFMSQSLDLLYVSPEKLLSSDFIRLLRLAKISLFAIDEAHCISSWGHDFRPEYTQLGYLKKEFPATPLVALTATADKLTRKDIMKQLGLKGVKPFIASFDRPNLFLESRPGQKRIEQILEFIKGHRDQAGIIYCLSRKSTEDLADKLKARGYKAVAYHAGLPDGIRSTVQEDFINDRELIICATIAFGMGIDKSNVRWVIHYNLPKNLEGYYQEIGRSGRDGLKSDTLLFHSYRDYTVLQDILKQNEAKNTDVQLLKLEQMYNYATASVCRRRILLNYFNELSTENCGNCDVCLNPPVRIDGTEIAQKALSAIARTGEQVAMTMCIDILRASGRHELVSKGFDRIKTYGAGRDISYPAWRFYIEQLLQMGLLDIALDDHQKLKLTEASKQTLFEGEVVSLVEWAEAKKVKTKKEEQPKSQADELFERLRKLRLSEARKRSIPPYLVFSDASIRDMVEKRPTSDSEMRTVQGVGDRKLQLYGDIFMDEIRSYLKEKAASGSTIKGASQLLSLEAFQAGQSPEEIAARRDITPGTVIAHLLSYYEKGEDLDLSSLISGETLSAILKVLPNQEEPYRMKNIFEELEGRYSYDQIKIALAYFYREVAGKE